MTASPSAMLPPKKHPVKRQAGSGRGIIRVSAATADAIDVPESIKEWDMEELRRGRRRDRNGKFTGRDPVVVPTNCYREILRRQIREAEVTMAQNLNKGAEALVKIATSPMTENRDKIAAIKLLIERVMGKMPEKLELGGETPLFIGILNGGIVPGPELDPLADDIIDVESTEIEWEG